MLNSWNQRIPASSGICRASSETIAVSFGTPCTVDMLVHGEGKTCFYTILKKMSFKGIFFQQKDPHSNYNTKTEKTMKIVYITKLILVAGLFHVPICSFGIFTFVGLLVLLSCWRFSWVSRARSYRTGVFCLLKNRKCPPALCLPWSFCLCTLSHG